MILELWNKPELEISWPKTSQVQRDKIAQKISDIVWRIDSWTKMLSERDDQLLTKLQAIQSPLARNDLLYPQRARKPFTGIFKFQPKNWEETIDFPYNFDVVDLWNERTEMWRKWFRFSGTNRDGKGFMVSWPIQGERLNVKHIWTDPEIRWGLGKSLLLELEHVAKQQGIKIIYSTFANEWTIKLFQNQWYLEKTFEQWEENGLWIEPKRLVRITEKWRDAQVLLWKKL